MIEIKQAGAGLVLYPNPVAGGNKIFLAGIEGENAKIKIYDMQGNLIRTMKYDKRKEEGINIEGLKAGVYILESIGEDGERRNGKFVKVR
ncbi:MAG: T9SS type A sorting domain-containing protein [Saprospiraceae bacterium]